MNKLVFKVETGRLMEAVKAIEVVDKKASVVIQFSLRPVKTADGNKDKFLLANITACDGKVKVQCRFAYLTPKKEAEVTAYKKEANEKGIVKTVIVEAGRFITNVTGLAQMGSVIEFEINGVMTMHCGQSLLHLPVMEKVVSDFRIESDPQIAVKYELKKLKAAVNRVQIASAPQGTAARPMFENLTFVVSPEGETTIYGGYRFWATAKTSAAEVSNQKQETEATVDNYHFAMSAGVLKSILNVTTGAYAYLFIMNKQVSIKSGNAAFTCQLSTESLYGVSARLDNWQEIRDVSVICDRGELMDALKLVKAASDCEKVDVSQEEGLMKIEASGNIASVDAEWDGEFETTPTNAAQILKYLQVCNTERVGIFSGSDDTTPLRIQEVIVSDNDDNDTSDEFTVSSAAAYIMRYTKDVDEEDVAEESQDAESGEETEE